MNELLNGFRFKKALGQNFIFDTNLLDSIVEDANICSEDVVVEIGTGPGSLTKAIAAKAKKVYSFEVDKDLMPIIAQNLKGCDNVEVIFKNILRMPHEDFFSHIKTDFKVVANIPYYITTPLIMYFIESNLPVISLNIMMQEEVARRLVARSNDVEYGAISLAVQLEGKAKIVRSVSRFCFKPVPKVDSSVLQINIDRNMFQAKDKVFLKNLIRAGFHMRRKTFANNVVQNFGNISKDQVTYVLSSLGYKTDIRGEALSLEDYIIISDKLCCL